VANASGSCPVDEVVIKVGVRKYTITAKAKWTLASRKTRKSGPQLYTTGYAEGYYICRCKYTLTHTHTYTYTQSEQSTNIRLSLLEVIMGTHFSVISTVFSFRRRVNIFFSFTAALLSYSLLFDEFFRDK